MSDTIKSWTFVIIQALLFGLLIIPKDNRVSTSSTLFVIGSIILSVGATILLISLYDLRKSLTPLPLPKKNGELQIHGLYRFVRHPMYVGVLVLSLGILVLYYSILNCIILIALYVLFSVKARYEEKLLTARYPEYKGYIQRTPRFIPRVRTYF